MTEYSRYAIYHAPAANSALARFGAAWLGWDAEAGTTVAHPHLPGLPRPAEELTAIPRKYGFHGTLKPPFRLATGTDRGELHLAVAELARRQRPVRLEGLQLARLGRFLALVPMGDTAGLAQLAERCVSDLDAFRAPPTRGELERRRRAGLSARQEALLAQWGYPYVQEEFRFHLTLTGSFDAAVLDAVEPVLAEAVAPLLPRPFEIGEICLFGEAPSGMFHILHRYALAG